MKESRRRIFPCCPRLTFLPVAAPVTPSPFPSLFFFLLQSLVLLLSERAALCESGSTSGWLAKHSGASSAHNDRLGVGEHGRDVEATLALDIHEERVRRLDQSLELVGLLGHGRRWVQEVNIAMQNHAGFVCVCFS